MSDQTASLVLRTFDLTVNTSNQYGTVDQFGTSFTWNNINLRVLLGDMYDKYDRFNLNLNTIATGVPAANIGTTGDDRCCYVTMSGLPWVNNTYNQQSGSNNNSSVIATFLFSQNTQAYQYYYGNNTSTFRKNQEMVNLNISFLKISTGLTPATLNAFPQMIFIFDIVGVEEYKINNVFSNLFIPSTRIDFDKKDVNDYKKK